MSTIRKNGLGYYFIDLRINGKRVRETLHTKDRKKARLRAQLRERELSDRFEPKRTTIEDFVDQYLEWASERKRENTVRVERSALKRFREDIGVKYVDEVTPRTAERFITYILDRKLSPKGKPYRKMTARGANYYLRTLRAAFSTAVRWEMIESNPFLKLKPLPVDDVYPRILKESEVRKILLHIKEHEPEFFDLITVYLFTGLRRAEAVRLTWDDIDFEARSIIIRRSKGRRSRVVPMMGAVYNALKSRTSLPRPFPAMQGDTGEHLHESTPTHVFKRAARACGLNDLSLHDLRRTFGSMLSHLGVRDFYVQKWLGHTDPETTRTYYIGHDDEMAAEKMREFEKRFTLTEGQNVGRIENGEVKSG